MTTFVLIEQTTDHRHPETRISYVSSEKRSRAWIEERPSALAFPGAANPALSAGEQNYHHRFRDAYEMPAGWRRPTAKRIEKERGSRPWDDRRSRETIIASIVRSEAAAAVRIESRQAIEEGR